MSHHLSAHEPSGWEARSSVQEEFVMPWTPEYPFHKAINTLLVHCPGEEDS